MPKAARPSTTRSPATSRRPTFPARLTGSVTFLQGETTKTITVTTFDDSLDEALENVTVTLSDASGTQVTPAIGTAAASATITDNDAQTSISIDPPADTTEGGSLIFTVTRTGDAEGSQTVNYAVTGDFEASDISSALTGSVTFQQGETTKTITVTTFDDSLDEALENVTVTLSDASGTQVTPAIGTAAASATITDNDAQTTTSISIDPPADTTEGGSLTFTVTRTGDAEGSQTVNYAVTGDFEASDISSATAGSVTFQQGETTQTITVTTFDDSLDEALENVTVTLSDASGTQVTPAIGTAAASATITDNDAQTSISISVDPPADTTEGGSLIFTVTRTGDAEGSQTVNYAVTGDFEASDISSATAGSVTFQQGETTQTITVTTFDDSLDEALENVTVTLSDASGTQVTPAIGTAAASATITDNDAQTTISIAADPPANTTEGGSLIFTVTRTGDAEGSQTVNYAVTGDFEASDISSATAGSVTFQQGETTQTITVTTFDDSLDEALENVTVTLSDASGTQVTPAIGTAAASATITDNDAQTTTSISIDPPADTTEGGSLIFTVTRTGDAEGSQTVNYAVTGDFEASDISSATTGSVTFQQGETTQTITVTTFDDSLDEALENVTVTLSDASGTQVTPAIGTAAASATITDNDAQTSISISIDPPADTTEGGSLIFTVTRTGDAEGSQTVNYAVTGDFEASDISSATRRLGHLPAGRDHQDHHRHHLR